MFLFLLKFDVRKVASPGRALVGAHSVLTRISLARSARSEQGGVSATRERRREASSGIFLSIHAHASMDVTTSLLFSKRTPKT
jgi:hypothetical protein